MATRRQHSAAFKAKGRPCGVTGRCANWGRRSACIRCRSLRWKKRAMAALPEVFATRRRAADQDQAAVQAARYEEIGRLKVELDWLKKKHEVVDR